MNPNQRFAAEKWAQKRWVLSVTTCRFASLKSLESRSGLQLPRDVTCLADRMPVRRHHCHRSRRTSPSGWAVSADAETDRSLTPCVLVTTGRRWRLEQRARRLHQTSAPACWREGEWRGLGPPVVDGVGGSCAAAAPVAGHCLDKSKCCCWRCSLRMQRSALIPLWSGCRVEPRKYY